ncbi:MAG: ATP-binding protein [Treponema sp.]|nr:ATP-binding protein [Treponema sp.]
MNMRKMPIGIQDFQKLREDGFVYVDKTALVYKLVQNACPYFLSRPRRFGKSLLVTTLEAYFKGRKELFEGLKISEYETEWAEYPVLKFSLAGGSFNKPEGLSHALNGNLNDFEDAYGLPHGDAGDLPGRFKDALGNARKKIGRRVAVLVDEYDNPLLKTFGENPELEKENRDLFKGFFAVLKDCDGDTRFILFTGVTKFSKVSIFSDLNQLQDISMDGEFADICGITQEEMERDFSPEIDGLAQEHGMTRVECLARLKQLYDGYHFSKKSPGIYNPFSLINALKKKDFGKYWFESGTPTFLVKRLKAMSFNPKSLSDGSLYTMGNALKDYRPDNPDILPLLYQSGYLTIKGYDSEFDSFQLGYPNDEVKFGFTESLSSEYLHGETPLDVRSFGRDLKEGNTDGLRDRFVALFARLPYASGMVDDSMLERDFQNVIYLTFLLLGQFVQVEQHSAKGRADCIVETDRSVYIFEFKRDGSADEALVQIASQGYARPYEADSRTLIRIGAVFSSEQKNISEWKVQVPVSQS